MNEYIEFKNPVAFTCTKCLRENNSVSNWCHACSHRTDLSSIHTSSENVLSIDVIDPMSSRLPPKDDEINNPKHYMLFPDTQVIDVIKRTLTEEEYNGYLKGNILKYKLRAGEKGDPDKCLGKANWYRNELNT